VPGAEHVAQGVELRDRAVPGRRRELGGEAVELGTGAVDVDVAELPGDGQSELAQGGVALCGERGEG
jgi:hypothetical protein